MIKAYISSLSGTSVQEQKEKLLKEYNCEQFYTEETSRFIFDKMIEELLPGDIIVLTSIKELPITTLQLINQVDQIYKKGAQIKSMDGVNWTELCILADFDKFSKYERNKTGLTGAKPRGRNGGRPKGLSPQAQTKARSAAKLYKANTSIQEIMDSLAINSKRTLYKYLRHEGVEIKGFKKVKK